jgi:predicted protein tyrosine phosphatase
MERKHSDNLRRRFPDLVESKPIHCLGIPDEYEFMDEDLVATLEAAVDELNQDGE